MKIKSFRIENFKSIENLTLEFDKDLSVLTGVNNSGKTTILEAVALWAECFGKLINQAKRSVRGKYYQGQFILGPTNNRYFDFSEINSVRSPYFEDIFRDRDVSQTISLTAELYSLEADDVIVIPFTIKNSTNTRYVVDFCCDDKNFSYEKFNRLFRHLPNAIAAYYASPISTIVPKEEFVTPPIIKEKLLLRQSHEIVRNRLYKLYHAGSGLFQRFQQDLSYILYGNSLTSPLQIVCKSDITQDTHCVINFKRGASDVEKDISLLGSGTLQVIEVLLNIYHNSESEVDLNLVLLDEPDSHIHRDIQKRLFEVLSRDTDNNQIIITTHNEAMIRNTPLHQMFHVDGTGKGKVKCMLKKDLPSLGSVPHFRGIYPDPMTPIIAEIDGNAASGLDFVSAIEADRIIFVEGDDDARLIYRLMMQRIGNANKKVMFFVVGGIGKIYSRVKAYKDIFSLIHNSKTLWEKSKLVFDRDILLDDHLSELQKKLNDKFKLPNYAARCYTQESVLLTDLEKTALLLKRRYFIENKSVADINDALNSSISSMGTEIRAQYNVDNNFVQHYKSMYLDNLNSVFGCDIKLSDIDLEHLLSDYFQSCDISHLCKKEDVANIVNEAFSLLGLNLQYCAEDFYSLVQQVDTSTMFDSWNEMVDFVVK